MTSDSSLFRTREQLEADGWHLEGNVFVRGSHRYLPLYEAKMLHHYDHRWATFQDDDSIRDVTIAEKQDSDFVVMPRYWVPERDVPTGKLDKQGHPILEFGVISRVAARGWHHNWLLGFRKICRATDERTVIAYIFPIGGVGDSGNLIFSAGDTSPVLLAANAMSYALDYVQRQKLGGTNLNFFQFEQLPFLVGEFDRQSPWDQCQSLSDWIESRVLELTYSTSDMADLARTLGGDGPPYRWDEERRRLLRVELDAAFFHLYGIERDDVDYIMETFPIVKRRDIETFGSYRTKELILEAYDAMNQAIRTGEPYQTILGPPPSQGSRHPESSRPA